MQVAQPRPTLCDPMDCSPPGSSVHVQFLIQITTANVNDLYILSFVPAQILSPFSNQLKITLLGGKSKTSEKSKVQKYFIRGKKHVR